MSAEPLPVSLPGTGRVPQTELLLASPVGGIEQEFRAIIDGNAETVDAWLDLNVEGQPRRTIRIRLKPVRETIREDGELRSNIYHFGDAKWWEIDEDGAPRDTERRCSGYVNLQVTEHDAPLGHIRTQI